jgi:hypothetical protein
MTPQRRANRKVKFAGSYFFSAGARFRFTVSFNTAECGV